ncbi:MAG: type II toxin-antitoxin system RelE/ParE family toxin [Candidatus Jettenia sp.]|nr:type II toxin-antitoxin system RelE/ParE family toxin [Candidatus Jettenia sp.]
MEIKILFEDRFAISAIMKGNECPAEESIKGNMEERYIGNCNNLLLKLKQISRLGFEQLSNKMSHYVNKDPKIYEIIQGKLRLIYFHGEGNLIVVCTEVIVKNTQKVDKAVVNRAIRAYNDYHESVRNKTLVKIRENNDENE